MELLTTIDRYTLGKTHIIANEKNSYHSCLIERNEQGNKGSEKTNLITIELKLVIREALNHCLKRKAPLIKVWINNKCISIDLITKEGAYSFNSMNYYSFLEVLPPNFADKPILTIEDVITVQKATTISLKLHLHQDGKPLPQISNISQIWVQFGSKKRDQSLRFEVAAFSLVTAYASQPPTFQNGKLQNKFQFLGNQASLPIGVVNSLAQVYEILNVSEPTVRAIQAFIQSLPAYSVPKVDKDSKLYLCHDMKGGYKQDINFDNNFPATMKPEVLEYRCLHLEQAEIFNYFSHYNITIPPLHWRMACKAAGTKCLGTFIIQQPVYSQQTLCSQEFALFLVALARKIGFDGYLLNIETKIGAITAFKRWVGLLTSKLHHYIPGSLLIWYDSISQKDGIIRYQNSLSQQNIEFYQMTDGIFTNYWWNEDLLKRSVELKSGNPRRVYFGNDCFGRNTYGGGMYGSYKAVNKILQYKNELAVALFAPGFTYEDNNAQNNRRLFFLNELALYKGIKSQIIPIDKWKTPKPDNWKREGDWTATSYELCERSALFNFPPLEKGSVISVAFMMQVMGTPPIAESPYKVVLQVLDLSGGVLFQTEANNFSNYRKTGSKPKLHAQELAVNQELVGGAPYAIKVIQMGKCAQQWAGHFGPRFRNEKVFVLIYQKERHWTSKFPVKQVRIGQTYHSFCNMGTGDSFHFQGLPLQKGYSFLADYDLPHTHIINHPFETEVSYDEIYTGGSSLRIKRDTIKLLKVVIPKGLDLKQEFLMQVTTKDTYGIQLNFKYISKNIEDRIFAAKQERVEEINGWKRFTFRLVTTVAEVKADIRSIIDIVSVAQPYFLGQIKIFQRSPPSKDVKCLVEACRDYLPTTHYFLNFTLQSSTHRRLLVQCENWAGFAYFIGGRAFLSGIPVEKSENFTVKVIDTDGAQDLVLRERVIEGPEIAGMIMHGPIGI